MSGGISSIARASSLLVACWISGAGAAELTSLYTYRTAIPYRAKSAGARKDEVEHYRINTFIFADEKGVPFTEPPYSDACQRIYPNKGENIAWLEARVILGLLDMYETTRDVAFLEQVVVHTDRVFNCRLDRRNQQRRPEPPAYDTHRNSSTLPAWPTFSYTHPRAPGSQVAHSVHSGFFAYAVARFVTLVHGRKLETFRAKADDYVPLLKVSLTAFDRERDDRGLYVFPAAADNGPWKIYVAEHRYTNATNVVQPVNMQAAMGLAFLQMQKIPRLPTAERSDYRARATRIARYVRGLMRYDRKHDSYTWPYWSWKAGNCREDLTDSQPETVTVGGRAECAVRSAEDVSHAAIDVDLAIASVEADLGVFTPRDLRRLANTLLHVVRDPKAPRSPRGSVDGKEPYDANSPDVVYWMGLARHDPRVYGWLGELLHEADIDPNPFVSEGYVANAQGFKHDRDYQGYAAFLKVKYAGTR